MFRAIKPSSAANKIVLGFWTEQYCSAEHEDTDQHGGSHGFSCKEQKMDPIAEFLTIASPLQGGLSLNIRAEAA